MRWLISVVVLCVGYEVHGQTKTFLDSISALPIKSTTVNYSRPIAGEDIRYHLPAKVDSVIDAILIDTEDYFAQFSIDRDLVSIIFYRQDKGKPGKSTIDILLASSNRYIQVSNHIIPFYFDTDIRFSFAKFAMTGNYAKVVFTGLYPQVGTIHFLSIMDKILIVDG